MLLGLILGALVLRDGRHSKQEGRKSEAQTAGRELPSLDPGQRQYNYTYDRLLEHFGQHCSFDGHFPLPTPANFTRNDPTWHHYPTTTPSIFERPPTRIGDNRQKILVENWKKSIVGLVRLADRNLRLARQHLTTGDFKAAIQTAGTSVENVTRALIHCCGGKPDTDQGQEEALKLLRGRFEGNEKEELEKAADDVARVDVAVRTSSQTPQCSKEDAERALETASRIADLFKRILIDHFATEIPELEEGKCPKCHSLDVSTQISNQRSANSECNSWHHKWAENRD